MIIFPGGLCECVFMWEGKVRGREVVFQHKSSNEMEKKTHIAGRERRGSLSGWGSLGLAWGEDAALKLAHS